MTTFLDHVRELRSKILFCLAALLVGTVIAHPFHNALISLLLQPLHGQKVFFLSPLEPLYFIFKIDFFFGLILALPVINWSILSFVRPAIQRSKWLIILLLYGSTVVFILGGLAYAWFVIAPFSLGFLTSIHVPGIENMITANNYLNFLLTQSLIVVALFQVPLVIMGGTWMGIIDPQSLAKQRRYVYVGGLILLAVITPTTDLFSLGIVAVPAMVLFEGSLMVANLLSGSRGVPESKVKSSDDFVEHQRV